MIGNSNLVTKVYFPRMILPLSTVLVSLIDMAGEENGYPNKVLEINEIKVLQDPYRETCRKYRKRLFGFDEKAEKERKKKEENEVKIGPTVNKIIQM